MTKFIVRCGCGVGVEGLARNGCGAELKIAEEWKSSVSVNCPH